MATGYTGTVAVTSSDPIAGLPATYAYTAADAGVHTSTTALKRAGTQSLAVTDTLAGGIAGAETGIVVTPAAVTHLGISGPTAVTQGVGFRVTVSAVDDIGNVNPGYRGTVHLASTDPTGGTQNFKSRSATAATPSATRSTHRACRRSRSRTRPTAPPSGASPRTCYRSN